jgi:hypothetical protein
LPRHPLVLARVVRAFDRWGRPVDPGYGLPEGGGPDQGFNPDSPDQGFNPGSPGQGLPGNPGHPGHLPSWAGGRPVDPGYGVGVEHPDNGLPPLPPGIWGGGMPGQLPILPLGPDNSLPPMWGHPLPPVDPEPGEIYPPLTPGNELPPHFPSGKAVVIAGIPGVGWRYIVVTIPQRDTGSHPDQGFDPNSPDQGLPGGGGRPGHRPAGPGGPAPGQGLPAGAGRPEPRG